MCFHDAHSDCLVGQVRKDKRVGDLLAVFARLPACYPWERDCVMDNLNTHKHARLRAFMAVHNIEPVFTPTYASWLNASESHLGHRGSGHAAEAVRGTGGDGLRAEQGGATKLTKQRSCSVPWRRTVGRAEALGVHCASFFASSRELIHSTGR